MGFMVLITLSTSTAANGATVKQVESQKYWQEQSENGDLKEKIKLKCGCSITIWETHMLIQEELRWIIKNRYWDDIWISDLEVIIEVQWKIF